MQNAIEFTKKPFHGIFSEAAEKMGLEGKNARILARTYYVTGNRKAVSIVTKLIEERTAEAEKNKAIIEKAVSFQKANK